ncbi:EAL domain-containing protein [Sulfurimonas sp. SAG-AH-194-C20]|nr:EAL domain-containing protein [Sulfurimonas sp. SAG-AH-194-C20]MDF1879200.1 EAL domain-containing protein [Sulfurimonas sp. SAG-AH-194-C20]
MSRSITPITVVLITITSIFIVVLFQLYEKFKIDEKFTFYHHTFDELRILEKDFNIFLVNPVGLKDYDEITQKQERFEVLISKLEDSSISEIYEYDFMPTLKIIHSKFNDSRDILEYQKSLHAMTINKITYLFDLQKTISSTSKITEYEKKNTNEIVFMLIQYLNGFTNEKELQHKLINYNSGVLVKTLSYFYQYSQDLHKDMKSLSKLPNQYRLINLKKDIQNITISLDKLNVVEIRQLKKFSIIFSIVVIILMIMLIVLHRVSLTFQEALKVTASVFQNIDEGILIIDENKKIIDINKAMVDIFGHTKEACIGNTPKMFQSGFYSEIFYERMWNEIKEKGSWQGKINDLSKDGTVIPSWMNINTVKNTNGEVINYIAIHKDLSEIINSQARVNFLAFHDSLTELPNRISFEENLAISIKYAQRNNTTVVILFIDLDRFKIINDSLGHDIGDKLLQAVARRLKNSIRELDSLARMGGDEFIVTLENIDHYFDISKVAKKIITELSIPFNIDGYTLNTSASIGIAQYPKDANDSINLVKYADIAMYKAKENGKNCFSFFTDKISDSMNKKLELEQELRKALQKNELYLNFQPQYLLKNQKVIAVESLIRWSSSTMGMIGPDKFIPVAEDSGLINEIGYFVFRESCIFMKELREKGIFLEHIAVNVSSIQFRDSDLVERFLKILTEYGLTPDLIEIEITERYIMESTEANINILDALKENNFKISIDDFGTGYSSMSYIKNLPLDTLKIDKSFVDDLEESVSDRAIAKAIITLANSLEHHCVAEGIETLEQEQFLEKEGCEIGQGFYYSKPLGKKECIDFIISH